MNKNQREYYLEVQVVLQLSVPVQASPQTSEIIDVGFLMQPKMLFYPHTY